MVAKYIAKDFVMLPVNYYSIFTLNNGLRHRRMVSNISMNQAKLLTVVE